MSIVYRNLNLDAIWGSAWEHAKKYFLPIFAMNVIIYFCSNFVSSLFTDTTGLLMLMQNANAYSDPEQVASQMLPLLTAMMPKLIMGGFIGWLLANYFYIALYRLLIDGVKGQQPNVGDRVKGAWTGYLNYIIITFICNIVIGIGYVFFILPGLFLTVRLLFVPIIAANKPDLTLGEVFSESWNLTRGHFWTLLGYGIVAILINIVGFICCCVGILFTHVATQFLLADTYYVLAMDEDDELERGYNYDTGE